MGLRQERRTHPLPKLDLSCRTWAGGVVSTTDSGADQPDGRRTVILTGAKGSGAGTGILGRFDDVTVQVPNPF